MNLDREGQTKGRGNGKHGEGGAVVRESESITERKRSRSLSPSDIPDIDDAKCDSKVHAFKRKK